MNRVVIVGGGVLGLLSCRLLAATGANVVLLESAGRVGRESSWAGGGIVSPLYPWRYSAAVTALAHWSQDFYPGFAQQLLEDTGVDPERRPCPDDDHGDDGTDEDAVEVGSAPMRGLSSGFFLLPLV